MQFYITDDGIRLNAKLDMPIKKQGKLPLVIIIHGFTGHMEERHITAISEMLNSIGCATLRVDMYGHGNSGGSFEKHTLYKWLTNAMTVIDYARTLPDFSDLYLCGHSQGGLAVMLVAALKHDEIRGIIPMSPAVCIPDDTRKGEMLGCHFDPKQIPDRIQSEDGWGLDGNYIRVAQTIYVDDAVKKYNGPVCLIHGVNDETIPVEYSIQIQQLYSNAELTMIPDDTHCYDYHLDQAVQAVKSWMLRQLSEKQRL
ncbi:MAG: alpha/beta fold hydrolase [Oscillospiraceae bacterium]|nr:alpha/beta fold hydrolase [Oscillospiraceae bacterium]